MNVDEAVYELELLPLLRQYAYGLTGSRRDGDEIVERSLIGLTRTEHSRQPMPLLIELLQILHKQWLPENLESDDGDDLHDRVLSLPLQQRQALLLVRTMGFSVEDAARALDISIEHVEILVATAMDVLGFLEASAAIAGIVDPNRIQGGSRVDYHGTA